MRFWGGLYAYLLSDGAREREAQHFLYLYFFNLRSVFIFLVFFLVLDSEGFARTASKEHDKAAPKEGINAGRYHDAMRFEDWLGLVAAHNNPQFSRHKLHKVYSQLLGYSGKQFKVFPYQTNLIGLAKPGGEIIIDISVIGKPIEVLAFWLAHEWAHQDLGHAVNQFSTPQMTRNAFLRRKAFPTSSEDEADMWAAEFLARHDYQLQPILQYFCGMENDSRDRNHSSWQLRALNVIHHYNRVSGRNIVPLCQGNPGLGYGGAVMARNY